MEFQECADRYRTAEVTRDDAGVVTVRMHTRGGPLQWGGRPLPADPQPTLIPPNREGP
ncbi:hypothetical protein [Candidatus Poriferisodalis sp.]|uniref:hypothetical protein n=1 Tax=Candidatus Poriferisodalis sp. TaxID=3101277 RepID=UPI003B01A93C